MKLLITGDTGFIGTHLQKLRLPKIHAISSVDVELASGRTRFNLLDLDATLAVIESMQLSHVLHLAWNSTASSHYEEEDSHFEWAEATYSLVSKLANLGIVSWVVGTGLEDKNRNTSLSPYAHAKLNLKSELLSLDNNYCRWISMPYVFSLYHQRPRVLKSCLDGNFPLFPDAEMDYLEIRDVAFQITNIIENSSSRISAVSSGMKIKNSVLCEQVRANRHSDSLSSCSCRPGHVHLPIHSGTQFTSLLLENS